MPFLYTSHEGYDSRSVDRLGTSSDGGVFGRIIHFFIALAIRDSSSTSCISANILRPLHTSGLFFLSGNVWLNSYIVFEGISGASSSNLSYSNRILFTNYNTSSRCFTSSESSISILLYNLEYCTHMTECTSVIREPLLNFVIDVSIPAITFKNAKKY